MSLFVVGWILPNSSNLTRFGQPNFVTPIQGGIKAELSVIFRNQVSIGMGDLRSSRSLFA